MLGLTTALHNEGVQRPKQFADPLEPAREGPLRHEQTLQLQDLTYAIQMGMSLGGGGAVTMPGMAPQSQVGR